MIKFLYLLLCAVALLLGLIYKDFQLVIIAAIMGSIVAGN